MKKKAILFSVIFFSLTSFVFAGEVAEDLKKKGIHVAEFSEEDKINLQINKLEQAIQQQQKTFSKKSLTSENPLTDLLLEEGVKPITLEEGGKRGKV